MSYLWNRVWRSEVFPRSKSRLQARVVVKLAAELLQQYISHPECEHLIIEKPLSCPFPIFCTIVMPPN